MKKLTLFFGLLFAFSSFAKNECGVRTKTENVDPLKYCYVANLAYPRGSILPNAGVFKRCVFEDESVDIESNEGKADKSKKVGKKALVWKEFQW